ncbi:hypothetical protein BD626DRAFT_541322 [Schizophyllum amplum]|uniref:Uncharacterized protein n=1 Tax=Schizophyllum amplum TaxID=97359 RepID=A0A550BV53_9AGAR|nr:hypothetical protein BD626DRAFT_541322 [Auriculariopsis ampla]
MGCTRKEVEDYMPIAVPRWDSVKVATLLESFAILGCNPDKLFRSNKEKAVFLKGAIAAGIHEGLSKITNLPKIAMHYKNYERKIVLDHGVVLDGWPATIEFKNPSDLSTALPPLEQLHKGIKDGTIFWRRLQRSVLSAREQQWEDAIAKGDAKEPSRKQRKDAGLSRKRRRAGDVAEGDDDKDGSSSDEAEDVSEEKRVTKRRKAAPAKKAAKKTGRGRKAGRSALIVPDDAESDAGGGAAGADVLGAT